MKPSELKSLTSEELAQRLSSLKRELFDLRIQRAAGKMDKPHRMRLARRDVARVLTILKEKQRIST